MAKLDGNKTGNAVENFVWEYTPEVKTKNSDVITLHTRGKYLDSDIQFKPNVRQAVLSSTGGDGKVELTEKQDGELKNITDTLTISQNQPSEGYYLKLIGSGSSKIEQDGWIDSSTDMGSGSGESFFIMKEASFSNTENADISYEDISENTPALLSGDYLYIDEGYVPASKISLAKLVPDEATIVGGADYGNEFMYNVTAYDKDGKLVTGTMKNAAAVVSKEDNVEIPAINSVNVTNVDGTFKIIEEKQNSAITVPIDVSLTQQGYLKDSNQITGSVNIIPKTKVEAELQTIGGDITLNGNNVIDTTLSNSRINIENVVDAAAANASATAPTSGVYVQVHQSSGNTTITPTLNITKEGYGTNANNSISSTASKTISVLEKDFYIPIKEGSISADEQTLSPSLSIEDGSGENANKYIFKADGSLNFTPTVNSGWVSTAAPISVKANNTMVINKSTADVVLDTDKNTLSLIATPGFIKTAGDVQATIDVFDGSATII